MRNAGLEEAQAGIKIAGRNINNLRYADDTTLIAESEEELKSLLMKVKKAERQRIDAFELWCWRRLLRVPWTARRSNQSILKEISSGCSLEGLMLKLKLQYFGHLMWRVDSLEKTLMLGRDWGQEKGTTEDEMAGWHHRLDGCEFEWTPGVGDGQGGHGVLRFMGSQRVGHDWATELNWNVQLSLRYTSNLKLREEGKIYLWNYVNECTVIV